MIPSRLLVRLANPTALLLLVSLALPSLVRAQVNLAVDATQTIRTVDEKVFGLNAVMWDGQSGTAQTIALVQAAGTRAIRIPGGSLSDTYDWSTNHSVSYDSVTKIWTTNNWSWSAGMDSFAKLITGTSAQAFVTVNYGTGTPQEAAAWVAYCNSSSTILGTGADVAIGVDSKGTDWKTAGYWSALRAAAPDGVNFLRIGRASPLGLKYWEIGNECYGTWEADQQTVQWDPYTYAVRAKNYITLMKAVDPTIKIGVVAVTGEDSSANNTSHPATNPNTHVVHNGWTPVMLATLKAAPAATPDYLIYHRYEQAPKHDQPNNPETDVNLLQKAKTWPSDAADLRKQLNDYLGSTVAAGIELMVTENNSVYSQPGKQTTSLVNGLFLADSIGNIMQTEINSLMWWDLRNGTDTANNNDASLYGWRQYGDYGILSSPVSPAVAGLPTTAYEAYPTYYAMKLLSKFARGGDTVVKATSSSSLLSVFAVRRADGSLALLVINKDLANVQNANIALTGYTPAGTATVFSYGKPQDDAAKPGGSGSTDIATSTTPVAGASFTASFAPYSVTVLSLTVPGAATVARDFNGDGKADVLWTNGVTGERSMWFMNGSAASGGATLGVVPVEWVVSGTGDYNGDGKADILWTNTLTGDRSMWLMNGGAIGTNAFMSTVPVEWVVSGTGDYNGDGKADIFWTNTVTGDRAVWLMNGSSIIGGAFVGTVPVVWSVSGTGDFNGDGKADVLWTNGVTGERSMWFMNGSAASGGATLGVVPVEWVVSGTGDYNGDGKADILWTNTLTGDRSMWLMNGSAIGTNAFMSTVPVEWVVSGTGDYNGDGKADIFWTNTVTGDRAVWLMNGSTVIGGAFVGTVPVVWSVSSR